MAIDLHIVELVADFLPDIVLRVQIIAALIHEAQMHGFTDVDGAAIGLFLTGDHFE